MLSDCIQIDEKVSSRISKASVAFSRLMNNQQTNEQRLGPAGTKSVNRAQSISSHSDNTVIYDITEH